MVQLPSDGDGRYRIRFADGESVMVASADIEVLSRHQESALGTAELPDLFRHVIYRCVVGSRAFGLNDEHSDVDIRGVFLPPSSLHWSLAGIPESIERQGEDECYWELERFLVLALKANPNILECLFTPQVQLATPIAEELLSLRSCFLSRFIHKTYNGYVLSQFKKLNKTIEGTGQVKWKHAMHLIRLLISAIGALQTGELVLDVGEHRARLLAIKNGEVAWAEIDSWRQRLQVEFDAAIVSSPLPERPDYRRINTFLIDARRQMVDRR
ncbi:MAG: nucleotidyltransferase domain-containing protein [Planctomycetota bacterium]